MKKLKGLMVLMALLFFGGPCLMAQSQSNAIDIVEQHKNRWFHDFSMRLRPEQIGPILLQIA